MRAGKTGRVFVKSIVILLLIGLAVWVRVPVARAISNAEQAFLSLYFTDDELHVISSTRSLQSIARIAENVSVVTAEDIELMNAHTMVDVLGSVPGVLVNNSAPFVSGATAMIQGPDIRHVTVLLNGVPLNNLSDNVAILGAIPVQDIAKVEIVKGPASSVWGSAMGGVVNIITKGPGARAVQGSVALDYGSENTGDYRAAISGRLGGFGYAFSGTKLRSDGLVEGFDADAEHLSARLDYAIAERTSANFTLFYGDTNRGDGIDKQYDLAWSNRYTHLVSQLAVNSRIGRAGQIDLSLWTTRFDNRYFMSQLSDDLELSRGTFQENRSGASAKYSVSQSGQDLVLGVDYSAGTLDASTIDGADPELKQWAVFANDTIGLGNLTLTPGIRYDDISIADNFLSPSLGITFLLAKDTLLRATVARGFSIPTPGETSGDSEINRYQANPDLTVEKMWSYQAGFESGVLDTFWLKVSAYRHDVEDAIADKLLENDWWTRVNAGRQRRQGLDVELRTKPIHNVTLAGSACFLDVRDLETDKDVIQAPKEIYDVSLKYDDLKSFRALLKGRYLRMDEPEGFNEDFSGIIVDLNLIKKIISRPGMSLEAFIAVHNLLNESQYHYIIYENPERWVEGGLRASF